MSKLWEVGNISSEINIRHMSDIILNSDSIEEIPYRIQDKILVWVDNDLKGTPLKNELDIVNKLIKKIWNI